MGYSLMSAQCVNILVILLTNFTEAWHCVDVCIDNVPLTMLPLAKVLSTEATAEWMVAEGILQTIIVNYDLSSFLTLMAVTDKVVFIYFTFSDRH